MPSHLVESYLVDLPAAATGARERAARAARLGAAARVALQHERIVDAVEGTSEFPKSGTR